MPQPKRWEMSAVATLKEWAASPEIGAVIVTGAGRGFCAGGDVSAMDRGTEMGAKGATLEQKIDSLRERQTLAVVALYDTESDDCCGKWSGCWGRAWIGNVL